MSGIVKTGQAVTAVFTTAAPTTGAATNADSLPTGVLYVNGTANGATVTVTNITTGRYKAAVTLPSLAAGDVVDIHIAATVGGVAGGGVVWSAVGDINRISDSTPQTGDSYARIPGVLQTKAEADTAHGLLATAAALAALNNLSPAQAQTAAAAALAAYDPPTHAELTAGLAAADDATLAAIAGLNNLSSAQVASLIAAGDDATLAAIAALNNVSSAQVEAAALAALAAYPVPLIADIEAAIAAGAGATPETFWNYIGPGGRTLSQSMIAILSSMIAGSAITITRGDTISITITGLGNLEDRTGLWFTVKANPSKETDLQARIQMTEIDGLVRLNGKAATDPTDGGVVVDDEANGDITVMLTAEASAALASAASWHWDVQVAQPGPGVWTPRTGAFVVTADVTRAT